MAATCVNLDNGWRFHLGEPKRWDRLDHQVCYDMTKAGSEVGDMRVFLEENEWQEVSMPHDWCTALASDPAAMPSNGFKPRTVGWYYLSFDVPAYEEDAQLLLEFEGVMGESRVYVNGTYAMCNQSGYTGFFADVSDLVQPGENHLVLYVDNRRWEGWWYEGAGIYRPVRLLVLPGVHIAHLSPFAHAEKEGEAWMVQLSATIANSTGTTAERTVCLRILDAEGRVMGHSEQKIHVDAHGEASWQDRLPVPSPALWTPEEPCLYQVRMELQEDGKTTQTQELPLGFRQITWTTDRGMLLNGVPTRVKGICCHQDHAGVGIAVPGALDRYRVGQLKRMGCNALRCAHNAVSESLLSACDELGMLVMAENRRFNSSEEALHELDSLVLRARNHPSVFLYSLFNEEPWQAEQRGFRIARRMLRRVRRLDDTRAVTAAMNGGVLTERNASDVLDVAGMNYFIDDYMKYAERCPDRAMIGTENGPIYATRGVYKTDEAAQVYDSYGQIHAPFGQALEDTMEKAAQAPHVAGIFMWGGFDYRGEPQPHEWPSVFSHWGFHDNCGFPKDTAYLLGSYYLEQPMVHLLPHWNWQQGEQVRVCAFTNCEAVSLWLNGRELGTRQAVRNRAEWTVPFEPGELTVTARQGETAVADSVRTAGSPAALVLEDVTPKGRRDACILNLDLVDAHGTHVPEGTYEVQFQVENAVILGVGNGDPNGTQKDCASSTPTFKGRCQLIVKPTGAGAISIFATADGPSGQRIATSIRLG